MQERASRRNSDADASLSADEQIGPRAPLFKKKNVQFGNEVASRENVRDGSRRAEAVPCMWTSDPS